jgi:hypothetical protein
MPDTIDQIVADLKDRFSDLTTANAIRYVNLAHRELCAAIPGLTKGGIDIDLVNGQASYALSGDDIEIEGVLCKLGGTAKLTKTHQSKLIEETPLWGADAAGIPTEFYVQLDLGDPLTRISTLKIVLHPKPNADMVSGLHIYGSIVQTYQTGDVLPGGLATYSVYTEGASFYAAEALRGTGQGAPYWNLFVQKIKICHDRLHKMIPQDPLTATYPISRDK